MSDRLRHRVKETKRNSYNHREDIFINIYLCKHMKKGNKGETRGDVKREGERETTGLGRLHQQ